MVLFITKNKQKNKNEEIGGLSTIKLIVVVKLTMEARVNWEKKGKRKEGG